MWRTTASPLPGRSAGSRSEQDNGLTALHDAHAGAGLARQRGTGLRAQMDALRRRWVVVEPTRSLCFAAPGAARHVDQRADGAARAAHDFDVEARRVGDALDRIVARQGLVAHRRERAE